MTTKKNFAISMATAALVLGASANDEAALQALKDMAPEFMNSEKHIITMCDPLDTSAIEADLMREVSTKAVRRINKIG